jgi:enamine deaminase RidA (YjgF/YER057c/UK114 family)
MSVADKLKTLGLELPAVAAPVGAYVPARRVGAVVMTSGQLPIADGRLTACGAVPEDVSLEAAKSAAALAVLNALAAAAFAAGGLERITGIARLGVFVRSSPGFSDQAQVANGASDLILSLFGDPGRHVRAAVGVTELPLGAAVEIEMIAEICD